MNGGWNPVLHFWSNKKYTGYTTNLELSGQKEGLNFVEQNVFASIFAFDEQYAYTDVAF